MSGGEENCEFNFGEWVKWCKKYPQITPTHHVKAVIDANSVSGFSNKYVAVFQVLSDLDTSISMDFAASIKRFKIQIEQTIEAGAGADTDAGSIASAESASAHQTPIQAEQKTVKKKTPTKKRKEPEPKSTPAPAPSPVAPVVPKTEPVQDDEVMIVDTPSEPVPPNEKKMIQAYRRKFNSSQVQDWYPVTVVAERMGKNPKSVRQGLSLKNLGQEYLQVFEETEYKYAREKKLIESDGHFCTFITRKCIETYCPWFDLSLIREEPTHAPPTVVPEGLSFESEATKEKRLRLLKKKQDAAAAANIVISAPGDSDAETVSDNETRSIGAGAGGPAYPNSNPQAVVERSPVAKKAKKTSSSARPLQREGDYTKEDFNQMCARKDFVLIKTTPEIKALVNKDVAIVRCMSLDASDSSNIVKIETELYALDQPEEKGSPPAVFVLSFKRFAIKGSDILCLLKAVDERIAAQEIKKPNNNRKRFPIIENHRCVRIVGSAVIDPQTNELTLHKLPNFATLKTKVKEHIDGSDAIPAAKLDRWTMAERLINAAIHYATNHRVTRIIPKSKTLFSLFASNVQYKDVFTALEKCSLATPCNNRPWLEVDYQLSLNREWSKQQTLFEWTSTRNCFLKSTGYCWLCGQPRDCDFRVTNTSNKHILAQDAFSSKFRNHIDKSCKLKCEAFCGVVRTFFNFVQAMMFRGFNIDVVSASLCDLLDAIQYAKEIASASAEEIARLEQLQYDTVTRGFHRMP
jgi:hypothetical protein